MDKRHEPFTVWIQTYTGICEPLFKTADYNFARKSCIRRVTSGYAPKEEVSEQPILGEVRTERDLLFSIRRIVRTTPSGRRSIYIRVTRDWQYEDSPWMNQDMKIDETSD